MPGAPPPSPSSPSRQLRWECCRAAAWDGVELTRAPPPARRPGRGRVHPAVGAPGGGGSGGGAGPAGGGGRADGGHLRDGAQSLCSAPGGPRPATRRRSDARLRFFLRKRQPGTTPPPPPPPSAEPPYRRLWQRRRTQWGSTIAPGSANRAPTACASTATSRRISCCCCRCVIDMFQLQLVHT
jgi:hypothetical protein